MKKPVTPGVWIALKHKTNGFGEWSISPRTYFEEKGHIPDGHAFLDTPGLDEVMDHTLLAKDGSDGRALLLAAGFEIVDNPVWSFDRPGYVDPDDNGGMGPQLLSVDEMMKAMLISIGVGFFMTMLISIGVGFFMAMVVMENIPVEKKTSATYFAWYCGSIGVSLLISVLYFKLRNKKVCEYASKPKASPEAEAPGTSESGGPTGEL